MARALYVIDDGGIPPDFNYMDGFLYPKPAHLPYIAYRPVPTFPDAATTIYGNNETVQFGAFLSTIFGLQAGPTYKNGDQTMVPAPAPGVVVPAVFGTTTPADFSPVISVTWGAPSVGSTITLTASNTHPAHAGDKVTFTAVASGMPSGDYLYVCAIPGGSGSLKVKGPGPMLAGPSRSTTISGWASGRRGAAVRDGGPRGRSQSATISGWASGRLGVWASGRLGVWGRYQRRFHRFSSRRPAGGPTAGRRRTTQETRCTLCRSSPTSSPSTGRRGQRRSTRSQPERFTANVRC